MKKLIVFSVVFALVAGAGLFAADVGIEVFTHVNVLETNGVKDVADDDKVTVGTSGGWDRLRLSGSGENGDGTFGGYYRIDVHPEGAAAQPWEKWAQGIAWWKPIDQFKMTIGKFTDGMYGKEGWAGWMFYQMPSDAGIVIPDNVWSGGYFGPHGGHVYRDAFFGGFEIDGMAMEIIPMDMFNLVISFPFFNGGGWYDQLQNIMVQGNVNLDFGSISLTYMGADGPGIINPDEENFSNMGKFYLSTSISAVENLGLDFGIGFPLPATYEDAMVMDDIKIGLGAKYDVNDAFGIKVRFLTALGGQTKNAAGDVSAKNPIFFGLDLLPYYAINDNMKVFIGLGFAMKGKNYAGAPGSLEAVDKTNTFGFHFNPYVQVGSEWGPCIYFGVKLWADDLTDNGKLQDSKGNDYTPINFQIPIGIQVSY